MAKQEPIRVDAVVKKALPNARFDVQLTNGHMVLAHVSGKMRMHFIRILPGDKVTVEPLFGMTVEKDLIVDMEPFWEHYRSVKPFFISEEEEPEQEWIQSAEQRERFDDTTKCI